MRSFIALALLAALHGPLATQGISQLERDRGQDMLGGLNWVLDTLYYDGTVLGDGKLQADLWWRARLAIDTARSWPAILLTLATFLEGFHDSHTTFLPPPLTVEVDFGWSWRVIGDEVFVTRVSGGAQRAGLEVGDRVISVDRIPATPVNMRAIWYAYHLLAPRRNIQLVVARAEGERAPIAIEGRVRQRAATMDYGNIEHVRVLVDEAVRAARVRHRWATRDSVAVWGFDAFGHRDRGIDQRMREARRYPWLVLDLRGNAGGSIETLSRLLGHFFPEEFVAFEQRWRDSTSTHRVTPAGNPYHGQVIVLVDQESASSSEIFSRVVQLTERGRVIGDRTAGAVRTSVRMELVNRASATFYQYGMYVSVADIIMSDGSSLEGVGVTPDVTMLPTGDDLRARRDPVLQHALELAGLTLTAAEAARLLR